MSHSAEDDVLVIRLVMALIALVEGSSWIDI
jgi:hypothetical protein